MSEPSDKGHQPDRILGRWINDEIVIDMSNQPNLPPKPLPEKVRAQFKAERARWAQLAREDPQFHAELERRGIHLTPEELQKPPESGNAEATPS